MTDKQIIKFLAKISVYCNDQNKNCEGCKFYTEHTDSLYKCQIRRITKHLGFTAPFNWNIKTIESVVNE